MRPDGSDVRRVTDNPNGDAQPNWSPRGDRIVFWGTRAAQTLYVTDVNGRNITQLVPHSLRPLAPAWSLMGESILLAGYRMGSGYSEIMRVAPDGSGPALLTFNEVDDDYGPGWLPGR